MPKKGTTIDVPSVAIVMRLHAPEVIAHNFAVPPDDHPIYHFIGRVAAEWSRLEHALDRIIWALADTLSPKGACITSQLIGATPRYKVILAQLHLRKTDPEFEKFVGCVKTLITKSYGPQDDRNRIIHDAWYLDADQNVPGQFRSWPHKSLEFGIKPIDLKDIEATLAKARHLAESAETLYDEINDLLYLKKGLPSPYKQR